MVSKHKQYKNVTQRTYLFDYSLLKLDVRFINSLPRLFYVNFYVILIYSKYESNMIQLDDK